MPNLINDQGYNGLGSVAQNYRRSATGGSNLGTRRLQFYTIAVYGLSDSQVASLDDYRVVNNTEVDIDQEPEREFRTATIVEAIIRGIQVQAEVYLVGAHDIDGSTDDRDLYLTIAVNADTLESGWEQLERDSFNAHDNEGDNWLISNVGNSVYGWTAPDESWGLDVFPTFIYGDHFAPTGMVAMPREELSALRAANKAARAASGRVSFKR